MMRISLLIAAAAIVGFTGTASADAGIDCSAATGSFPGATAADSKNIGQLLTAFKDGSYLENHGFDTYGEQVVTQATSDAGRSSHVLNWMAPCETPGEEGPGPN